MSKQRTIFRSTAWLMQLLICLCLPAFVLAEASEDQPPRYRALLIACDSFVSATDTTPIGQNNLMMMQKILSEDTRGFDIHLQYDIISSREALRTSIEWAFDGARHDDVSLLYLCTHGRFDPTKNNPEGTLLLSDGSLEDEISAAQLGAMLDNIEGTKVLLIDACNSGALIGKGISPKAGPARVMKLFQSDDYKVLTSSGASEPSWYWQRTADGAPPGQSYFTTALALGAGFLGEHAADRNRDGIITMKEMYDYLWINQASSVVQAFPQDDDFPLFQYDRNQPEGEHDDELNGFVFPSTWLDRQNPTLAFEYTARVPTRVAYRITYLIDGQWDWDNGVTLPDATEFDGDADPLGDVNPGRKRITLDLEDVLPDGWTYAMIHVMTLNSPGSDRQPFIYCSRVLAAKSEAGDPALRVKVTPRWSKIHSREVEIVVHHTMPCGLTVSVLDEDGRIVRRLCTSRQTRPQSLLPDGSQFYWDGCDKGGVPAPPGKYRVVASTAIGDDTFADEAWLEIE